MMFTDEQMARASAICDRIVELCGAIERDLKAAREGIDRTIADFEAYKKEKGERNEQNKE